MEAPLQLSEWESDRLAEGLSFGDDESARRVAAELTRARVLLVAELASGISVSATSHVGSLQLGPLQLRIRPKIEGASLLVLLRYAYGLRNLRLLAEHQSALEASSFQDLLLYQLVAEVSELIRRGLFRQYRRREELLASPRGRIDFRRMASSGGVVEAALPCLHYDRLVNCPPNQVIVSGLMHGARMASDVALRSKLRRLAARFAGSIDVIPLDHRVFRRLRRESSRLTHAYEPALRLVELVVAGEGVSTSADQASVRLPGFLFDMNRFFEELLGRFLGENLTDHEVRPQVRLRKLFAYQQGHNPQGHKAPEPRPDFVVMEGGKVTAILDAKYRDLWAKALPSGMLYQLALYAMSDRHCHEAAILYPTTDVRARDARIEVRDPVRGTARAVVVLRPVHMNTLVELLSATASDNIVRRRQAFAHQLALGVSPAC